MNIIINTDKCISCKACILICENNALSFKEIEDGAEIVFRNNLCLDNCKKCIDICPFNAIKIENGDSGRENKYFISYYKCEKCKKLVPKNIIKDKKICFKCRRILGAENLFKYNQIF